MDVFLWLTRKLFLDSIYSSEDYIMIGFIFTNVSLNTDI